MALRLRRQRQANNEEERMHDIWREQVQIRQSRAMTNINSHEGEEESPWLAAASYDPSQEEEEKEKDNDITIGIGAEEIQSIDSSPQKEKQTPFVHLGRRRHGNKSSTPSNFVPRTSDNPKANSDLPDFLHQENYADYEPPKPSAGVSWGQTTTVFTSNSNTDDQEEAIWLDTKPIIVTSQSVAEEKDDYDWNNQQMPLDPGSFENEPSQETELSDLSRVILNSMSQYPKDFGQVDEPMEDVAFHFDIKSKYNAQSDFMVKAASGYGTESLEEQLERQMDVISTSLADEFNNGQLLNLNSNKQVSKLVYGDSDSPLSTSRDTLEAMLLGTANYEQATKARQVLAWRKCHSQLKRLRQRRQHKHENNIKQVHKVADNTNVDDIDPLFIMDASAFIFRAYHSMPPLHRAYDGQPVGAVLGFCNLLSRMVMDTLLSDTAAPPRLVLVFDPRNGSTVRKELYPAYKANRPPCPMDLVPQFEMVQEAAREFGIPILEAIDYEADDVIATVATWASQHDLSVHILSSDKDLLQLVGPRVCMVDPISLKRMDVDDVIVKWGVPPDALGDVLALAGDASDNIPGVPGIGPKIAAQLVNEYGSLEQVLAQAPNISQPKRREALMANTEKALMSRQLVELCRTVPTEKMLFLEHNDIPITTQSILTLRMKPLNQTTMLSYLDRMGFQDLKRRMVSQFGRYNNRHQNNNH